MARSAGPIASAAFIGAVAAASLFAGPWWTGASNDPQPSPELAPGVVVKIQVDALAHNAEMPEDGGIRIAFRFASPANRATTGPIEHFVRILKSPAYRPLLDHRTAKFGQAVVDGEQAAMGVTLTTRDGRRLVYLFFLSRQHAADCDGCWMTDSVYPWPNREVAPPRQIEV